jgi:uncharacterized damage-inducible protein DinB
MAMDRAYIKDNDAQRERLRNCVAKASDAELARPMPAGWTVAAVLGHLAFWDQRALILLERCQRDATATPGPLTEIDVHWINDASKPFLLAVAPRRAADLAVAAAEAVDRAVSALPDEFIARNAASPQPIILRRAEHRQEHLDEIEHVLGRPS